MMSAICDAILSSRKSNPIHLLYACVVYIQRESREIYTSPNILSVNHIIETSLFLSFIISRWFQIQDFIYKRDTTPTIDDHPIVYSIRWVFCEMGKHRGNLCHFTKKQRDQGPFGRPFWIKQLCFVECNGCSCVQFSVSHFISHYIMLAFFSTQQNEPIVKCTPKIQIMSGSRANDK